MVSMIIAVIAVVAGMFLYDTITALFNFWIQRRTRRGVDAFQQR
jgi:hypothetical protein